eukprot:jgi/Ulvmu1/7779/UM004_0008.1
MLVGRAAGPGEAVVYCGAVLILHVALLTVGISRNATTQELETSRYIKGLGTISASIISWLTIGHGLLHNLGPPFFGSSSIILSGLDVDGSPAIPFQAAVLALAASAALAATSDRITIHACLLLAIVISGIVVPVTARTVWHSNGVFTAGGTSWAFISNGVGAVDVGGGGVIHCTAGMIALALCLLAGPSKLRPKVFEQLSDSRDFSHCGQHMQATCVFWAGFAIVHALSVSDEITHDYSLPAMASVATLLSGCVGCITGLLQEQCRQTSPNYQAMAYACSRAVRVSVATVSASCTVVPLWTHFLSVPLAVLTAGSASTLLDRHAVCDAADAIAVHLVGGVVGILSVGFFSRSDLLLRLPPMPTTKAAAWSEGIAFGGLGNQLAAQLLWLMFCLTWSLLLVVPVTVVLRALGALRDDPDRHVAAIMQEAKQEMWKECWTWRKEKKVVTSEFAGGLHTHFGRLDTRAGSSYRASTRRSMPNESYLCSGHGEGLGQDWRPVKAHDAMREAIKVYQQQEDMKMGYEGSQRDALVSHMSKSDSSNSRYAMPQDKKSLQVSRHGTHVSNSTQQSGSSRTKEEQGSGSTPSSSRPGARYGHQSISHAEICTDRSGGAERTAPSGTGMDRMKASPAVSSQYAGVLSPLTAALMMAHDGSYTLQTSSVVMNQLSSTHEGGSKSMRIPP